MIADQILAAVMTGGGIWPGWQAVSALAPRTEVIGLLVLLLMVCGVMYLLVLLFLVVSIGRPRQPGQGSVRGVGFALVIWFGLVAAGLLALNVAGHATDASAGLATAHPEGPAQPVSVLRIPDRQR